MFTLFYIYFNMNRNKEYIIAAAIKLKPEFIQEARIYKDPKASKGELRQGDDIYKIEIGRSHADIFHRHGNRVDRAGQGFYTNWGRFVDRDEAYQIALANEQIKPQYTCSSHALFSEDIFWYDWRYDDYQEKIFDPVTMVTNQPIQGIGTQI